MSTSRPKPSASSPKIEDSTVAQAVANYNAATSKLADDANHQAIGECHAEEEPAQDRQHEGS